MKKNFCTILFILTLLACLCLPAMATQTAPAANENFAFLCAVSGNDMETETLTAGFGDTITLHLYVNVEERSEKDFLLEYNTDIFTLKEIDILETEGQNEFFSRTNADGSVSFHYEYAMEGAYRGLFCIATITFENTATVSETVHTFSLTQEDAELCNPVSVQVNHRHAFGNWSTVSVSEDGKTQKQKRECLHCDVSQTQTVPYVDYSISLKPEAKKISYKADKKLLYAIAPGMTVGQLIDSLTCVGNMQVVDKNGNGKSRNDILATGMTLLVMDEGDGMDANVQFAASVSVWGDGDGDGAVTAGDARIALRCSVDLEENLSEAQMFALDTDSNNNITAGDARFLLRVSVELDGFYAINATSVVLLPEELNMKVGEQKTLEALLFPVNTTIRTIQWSSSNSAVASVTNGTVTAKGMGTAVITATAKSGVKATCVVSVIQPVRELTCKRVNFYLPEGKTLNLTDSVEITPSDVTPADAVWKSSNSAFTVTNGVVSCTTAYNSLSNKKTSITCTFPCGTTATFNVTLIPSGATFCRFNYETVQVDEGMQFKLSGAISSGSTLKLVSDNTDVLTVNSDNIITAKSAGTATLICSGVNYSEKVTVTVRSTSLRVVSVVANSGDNDLAITVKNTDTQDLTKINMTVAGYDRNGNLLITKGCAISNLAAGARAGYVWKDLWENKAVVSAKITQMTLTYADGHMATIPAGCWHVGE
ncbi:MAG: hypothetical protein E7523_04400 [Ruminococcaceae bacterium]|nr:hypothetical protein [Oscillospiraceae bacterium]